MATIEQIPLDRIEFLQTRIASSEEAIEDYLMAMERGVEFPAANAVFDGTTYWAYDGWHRGECLKRLERETMLIEWIRGTREEAEWLALAANQKHGLRLTANDKKQIVITALQKHPEYADRRLAEHCGVSHMFTTNIRREYFPETVTTERIGKDGHVYRATQTVPNRDKKQHGGRKATVVPESASNKTPAFWAILSRIAESCGTDRKQRELAQFLTGEAVEANTEWAGAYAFMDTIWRLRFQRLFEEDANFRKSIVKSLETSEIVETAMMDARFKNNLVRAVQVIKGRVIDIPAEEMPELVPYTIEESQEDNISDDQYENVEDEGGEQTNEE